MRLEVITRIPKEPKHKTPLLFIHGMWHGAWCWDEFFLPFFADAGWTVSALSLHGHAGSEGKIQGSGIMDYVHDVEEVVKTLPTPPVLVGHSMGGFIVQKFLERNSAPAGVLLASNPPYGLWHGTWLVFKKSPITLFKVLTRFRLNPLIESPEVAKWAFFSDDFPQDQFLKYYEKMNDESFRMFIELLGLILADPKKVKTPLLILGAEKDTVIPPVDVHKTARAYNTTAEIFPNMAHDMMLEKNWKDVAGRVMGWLKEKGID